MESAHVPACIEGFANHKYNQKTGVCERCGYERKGSSTAKAKVERGNVVGRPSKLEQTISRKDAEAGISMLLLTAQTIIVSARPDLKDDALTPQERILLADALTDEAFQSTTLKKWMTAVGKQQKHTKLILVMTGIILPRLARRGILPMESAQDMGSEYFAEASKTAGFSGDSPTGSDSGWESIPVASGGSPFIDRGNGFRENNVSGVVVETAPLRDSVENENGRREIQHASSGEIPSSDVESEIEQDRVTAGSHSHRSKKS